MLEIEIFTFGVDQKDDKIFKSENTTDNTGMF